MFTNSSQNARAEVEERRRLQKNILKFGIPFLDKSMEGIFSNDLVLVGATSGVGKTQLCVNIANANLEDNRRVHIFALEASLFEIEQRMKFSLVQKQFYSDPNRTRLGSPLSYPRWLAGRYEEFIQPYEEWATAFMEKTNKNLFVAYKTENFTVHTLTQQVLRIQDETDLVIVDHVHYFDFDGDNENRALKEIAKTARTLALEIGKPIILVSHLRKRDRNNKDLVPGMEEFHGSSDLYKVATKVISLAPGKPLGDGKYETFIRISKCRMDSSPTRFLAKVIYNDRTGNYENDFRLAWATAEQFEEVDLQKQPHWAKEGRDENPNLQDTRRSVRRYDPLPD